MNHNAPWTEQDLAALGTDIDAAIAARLGRTLHAVRAKRLSLGIAPARPRARRWKASEIALLGKFSDGEVAKLLKIHRFTVMSKRNSLGVPAFRK